MCSRLFSTHLTRSILFLLLVAAWSGCKRTKDTFTSRTFHEMTSRFNPLFNGNEAFQAGKLKIESSWPEAYDRILPVYKWPDEEMSAGITTDMDRAMEKAVKVITGHSMVIGGRQKNDYIDDSYMLIGLARFYKGEYFSALETFNYIKTNYDKGELAHEAKLWGARCKIRIGNPESAKTDLEYLYYDPKLPKELKPEVLATMGQMNILLEDWPAVAANMAEAAELAKKKEQRVRYTYIRGQALEREGNGYEASEAFYQVVDMNPSYEFYFQSQLSRARNFDVYAKDPLPMYEELEKMVRDEKNTENRDQLYYVMAEMALKEEEFEKAEDFLKKSIRTSVINETQKALSHLKLGEINFSFRAYPMAQAYYDSSSMSLPQDHPRYKEVKEKAEVLKRMVEDIRVIESQDSLQALSRRSAAEQRQVAERIVEQLIAKEEKEKREKELEELNRELALNASAMPSGPIAGGGPNAGKWYFYNPSIVSSGRGSFRRVWGDRPNTDNWAQKSRAVNRLGAPENGSAQEDSAFVSSEEQGEVSTDPYKPETYLERIPNSEADFKKSDRLIREAFIDLGLVYKNGLKDAGESIATYEQLLKRFEAFKERARVLYTLFLLYRETGDGARSVQFKNELISDYAGTEFAILAANDGVPPEVEEDRPCLIRYEKAYRAFREERFDEALSVLDKGLSACTEDLLAPHYLLVKALCLAGKGKREEMIAGLKSCYEKYPNSEVGIQAQSILLQLGESTGDEVDLTARGEQATTEEIGPYIMEPGAEHRFLWLIEGQVDISKVQIAFTEHNKEFHRFQKLGEQIVPLTGQIMLLVVTGLTDQVAAQTYQKALMKDPRMQAVSAGVTYKALVISKKNFTYFFKNKDVEGYEKFFEKNY